MRMNSLNRFVRLKCLRLRRIVNRYYHPQVDLSPYIDCLRGKRGIEVGGPSLVFKDDLPVYSVIDSIDCINHSSDTIWWNQSDGLMANGYRKKYICDTINLGIIPDESYDFLLSSHCLEHVANPLKALAEWLRILKHGAYMLIIVPDKRYTFDHLRPVTSFDHIICDCEQNTSEDDLTHLPEVVRLHDSELDLLSSSLMRDWSDNNQTRRMHHHVFDKNLLMQLANYCRLQIIRTDWINPYHIVMLAKKS